MHDDHTEDTTENKDIDFEQLDKEVSNLMDDKDDDQDESPQVSDKPKPRPAPRGYALDVMHPKQRSMRDPQKSQDLPDFSEPELPVGNEYLLPRDEVAQEVQNQAQPTDVEHEQVEKQIEAESEIKSEAEIEPDSTEVSDDLAGWHVPPGPVTDELHEPTSNDEGKPSVGGTADENVSPDQLEDESNEPELSVSTESEDVEEPQALSKDEQYGDISSVEEIDDVDNSTKPGDSPLSGALPANNLVHPRASNLTLNHSSLDKPTTFDTKQYHTPLKVAGKDKSKNGGLWIAALIILLIIIIVAFAAYYFVILKH